jgi:hypothetical protein
VLAFEADIVRSEDFAIGAKLVVAKGAEGDRKDAG